MVKKDTKEELDYVIGAIEEHKEKNGEGPLRVIDGMGEEHRIRASYDGAIRMLILDIKALARKVGYSGTYESLFTYAIQMPNGNGGGAAATIAAIAQH